MLTRYLKPFLKSSFFYTLAVSIEAIVPFILLPLLTRWLSPEEYGIWVIFVSLCSFLRPVINLTLQDAVRSRYFELSEEQLARYFWSSIAASTLIAVVFLGASPFISGLISNYLKFPEEWIWSAIVVAYLYGVFCSILAILQFRGEFKRFVSLQFGQAIAGVVAVAIFLLLGFRWQGVVLSRLFALLLTLLAAWMIARRTSLFAHPREHVRADTLRELLVFGAKYLPTGIGVVLLPLMNRVFVTHYGGLKEVGLYGMGALFGAGLGLLINGFIYAWQPKLFRAMAPGASAESRHEALSYAGFFSLLLPIAGICVAIGTNLLLPLLVGPNFLEAASVINWLIAAMVFQGYFEQNQAVLLSRNRIFSMSAVYLLIIAVNAALNVFWTPERGGIGSAQATCAAYLAAAILNGCIALRLAREKRS